jgi:hypothetical protein
MRFIHVLGLALLAGTLSAAAPALAGKVLSKQNKVGRAR